MSLEQFSTLLSATAYDFTNNLPEELLLTSEGNLQTFYAPSTTSIPAPVSCYAASPQGCNKPAVP